jgi:CheY-like chemotaxis protein/HPt (histidine-containing phosphotransfer) domain-containing protein
MVTSAALPGGSQRARAEGVAGYLAKPVSRAELLHALSVLLGSSQPDGQERRLVTRDTIVRKASHARILLAEDNTVNQQVALALLRKKGHEVTAVADGAKAVEAVRAHVFDLVLMDIQMPVMDGLEATRLIRRFKGPEELPIIALTAHAFAEERERSRAAGMNDFLAKPFKPDDLYELVDRWVPDRQTPNSETTEKRAMQEMDGPVSPVDLEGFRAIMREAGVEEVVDATVDIYLTEAPTIFEEIDGAVRSGDTEGTRRAAHSLKSASGNIRAGRLSDLLQAMEVLGKEGDVEGALVAFPELHAEFESVMTYLRSFR